MATKFQPELCIQADANGIARATTQAIFLRSAKGWVTHTYLSGRGTCWGNKGFMALAPLFEADVNEGYITFHSGNHQSRWPIAHQVDRKAIFMVCDAEGVWSIYLSLVPGRSTIVEVEFEFIPSVTVVEP